MNSTWIGDILSLGTVIKRDILSLNAWRAYYLNRVDLICRYRKTQKLPMMLDSFLWHLVISIKTTGIPLSN